MKILVAPNGFKETMSSVNVAQHIGAGLKKASNDFTIVKVPLADGGIGTTRIITDLFEGEYVHCQTTGPFNEPMEGEYGVIPTQRVAVIELAQVAGLHLVPKRGRNPLIATTSGVGKLLVDALKRGYRKCILGIGDSATIDCGVGALHQLGVRFFDAIGSPIELNCRGLLELHTIDMSQIDHRVARMKITIASDVKNVLTGRNGAIVYAKQKGAREKDMPVIRRSLRRFKNMIKVFCDKDLDRIPGSGAAGGIGGAFVALLNSQIVSGSGLIQEMVRLEEEVATSDFVITGEGKIDDQSMYGKTLKRVVDLAYIHKKPVILIAGSIAHGSVLKRKYNIMAHYSLSRISGSRRQALEKTGTLLEKIAYKIGREIRSTK